MKSKISLAIVLLLSLTACTKSYYRATESAPEFITLDSLHRSVAVVAPTPIVHAGRTLSTNAFLLINEEYKGWHIIDNRTIGSPRNVAYITAPGSIDGDVRGNALYIQNSSDLVVLDITDVSHPTISRRLESVLSELWAPRKPF